MSDKLATIDIKGKDYVLVNERIRAFRETYKDYRLTSEIIRLEGGVCVIKAFIADEKGNVIATDYLGNCIYHSYEEFNDHVECAQMRKQGKNAGSYFSDMVKTVIREAREEIIAMQSVKIRKN